jgi:Uma2 family endonuclease
MAAPPVPPLLSVEEYLHTSYPDGDREYLDGLVVERNVGTPAHSALLGILVIHLAAFEQQLGLAVRPVCRTRIEATRYRVPDVLVMRRPFQQTDRVMLEHR